MLTSIAIAVGFLSGCGLFLAVALILAEKKILNYGPCNVDINQGEKKITVEGGNSLLSVLADQEIFIPSACGGRGSCAYCKLKIHDGAGMIGPVEAPHLTDEEIAQQVRLSCQVKVRTDLQIEIPEELFRVKRFRGKLVHKRPLTYDILEVRVQLLEPKTIDFIAGQYVQLESEEYKGRESVMRAYSISSVPSDNRYIEMNIRRVPDGICTTWVFDHAKEGQKLYLSGPYGQFHLSDTEAPIIFIAGGSGMAPIWGILNDMMEKGIQREAVYFFGALTQADLFYTDELVKLSKTADWFTFVPSLSMEPEDSDWRGERGLITDVVSRHFPNTSAHEAYLCGSPGLIDASVSVLIKNGMSEYNVFYDKFA